MPFDDPGSDISISRSERRTEALLSQGDLSFDPIARPLVGGERRVKARSRLRRMGLAGGADQTGDVAEFDLFVQERGDRDLVRGVQDRRLGAPATQRVVSE